ncbi:MAG: hypothetical protein IIY31_03460, partial [Desulfovibrio sp.]|nr:hypothetical protein [Desulfovibrio sp.]
MPMHGRNPDTSRSGSGSPAPHDAPARRHSKRKPPWKSPFWCIWLVCSLALSAWLAASMPEGMHGRSAMSGRSQPAAQAQQAEGQAPRQGMRPAGADLPDVQAPKARSEASSGASSETSRDKPRERVRGKDREPVQDQAQRQAKTGRHHASATTGPAGRIAARALQFVRLFLFVALGALAGGVIEGRRWYMAFARSLGRLTRTARMPAIVGIAMPTALASAPAADSMLMASARAGTLPRSGLVAGGMANSFLAYLSHSIRVMYPVIAAIGIPGLLYFAIHIAGGLLVVGLVFLGHALFARRLEAEGRLAADACADLSFEGASPLPWGATLKKSLVRAGTLVFRLACISVPLILAMEALIRLGTLDFWEQMVPQSLARYFPEQMLAIAAAQLGGLVQSSAVSASLLQQGLITGPQILLAMLAASLLSNPFRALRRNLPTALAIFPAGVACTIVFAMQLSRMLTCLLGMA